MRLTLEGGSDRLRTGAQCPSPAVGSAWLARRGVGSRGQGRSTRVTTESGGRGAGMPKGSVFEDGAFEYVDRFSGCRVRRLTHYLGHSSHLYFTDPCWVDGGQSFVFTSDRGNQSNLFRYDLDSGAATQLTDLGHSSHLYFTDPCWVDGGQSFVFTSDRGNQSNLFRYDLDSGAATQLTDLTGTSIENERVFDNRPAGAFSTVNQKHYYWWPVSYTHLRAHETRHDLVCRLLLEKKKNK